MSERITPNKSILMIQSWQKVLGTLDKVPTGDTLFCGCEVLSRKSLFNFLGALVTPSPLAPKKSNVGIVGLLWMNQHQHCVGGGECKGTVRLYFGKSAKCPKTFDRVCRYLLWK